MKIFGGVIPFIGWRVIWLDADGEPTEGPGTFKADALEVEWLGVGCVLYVANARPA